MWLQYEAVAQLTTPDDMTESVPCGPDPARAAEAIARYVDAGFDEIYIAQMGPDQESAFTSWPKRCSRCSPPELRTDASSLAGLPGALPFSAGWPACRQEDRRRGARDGRGLTGRTRRRYSRAGVTRNRSWRYQEYKCPGHRRYQPGLPWLRGSVSSNVSASW
jgi:hypothetical protein